MGGGGGFSVGSGKDGKPKANMESDIGDSKDSRTGGGDGRGNSS